MVPFEDTCDSKEDKNLSHLTMFCGDRNGGQGEEHPSGSWLGGAICQSWALLQGPTTGSSISTILLLSCSLVPLSYLHPTSWLPLPLLIHSWLLLTAFSLCLLASALTKTEPCLSLGAHSQTTREGLCWLSWSLLSVLGTTVLPSCL